MEYYKESKNKQNKVSNFSVSYIYGFIKFPVSLWAILMI